MGCVVECVQLYGYFVVFVYRYLLSIGLTLILKLTSLQ